MQTNIALLAKRAIGEALKGNWGTAIELNIQILEKEPSDLDSRLRLGKAYIQTKQFNKAKKMFKEALQIDPINQVALKNIQLINSNKFDVHGQSIVNTSLLIKEPGTTSEVTVTLTGRGMTAESFTSGEVLNLKIKKKSVDVYKIKNKKEVLIGTITNSEIVNKLNKSFELKSTNTASVIRGKDKQLVILVKCTVPVFRSEKQDIRPYIKKGSLDEPDIELEELEVGV